MSDASTTPSVSDDDAVARLLDTVAPAKRQADARTLVELLTRATGQQPTVHGTAIGFGHYHYVYESGREGDTYAIGFAPRKAATVVYLMDGLEQHAADLAQLGQHTTGVGCLYLKDLGAVQLDVLERIAAGSYAAVTAGS